MTPERIEQERRAFESWYSRAYLPTAAHGRTFSKYQAGTYRLQHVHDAWQTWQARAAQSEWISVKDQLPDPETTVLVCNERGEIFTSWASDVDVFWFYFEEDDNRITHWQPLPARPPQTPPRNAALILERKNDSI